VRSGSLLVAVFALAAPVVRRGVAVVDLVDELVDTGVDAVVWVEVTVVLFVSGLCAQPASEITATAPARVSRDRWDIVMFSYGIGPARMA
jgi:hypothetical protein